MARSAGQPRVVVFIQENKTTDYYFKSMRAWGANVVTDWPVGGATTPYDPPHARNAYIWWRRTKEGTAGNTPFPGLHLQVDTDRTVPFYSWLAKTGTFFDYHFAEYGANSTPGHSTLVGGQPLFLTNPSFIGTSPSPEVDAPSIFRLAERSGRTWGAFTDPTDYPAKLYRELNYDDCQDKLHQTDDFLRMCREGTLPDLCYVWNRTYYDEHPPADARAGEHKVWRMVDTLRRSGDWNNTVCFLTYDDWGGVDDHVLPPVVETLPDGAVGYGPRVPLTMFGGHVKQGVDSRLYSQVSVPRTVQKLLGLPPIGVPRMDNAVDLADRVDPRVQRPEPPAYGSRVKQPAPPQPAPPLNPMPEAPPSRPMDPLYLNGGVSVPPPHDAPVQSAPPQLPSWLQAEWQKVEQWLIGHLPGSLERILGAPPQHHPGAPPTAGHPSRRPHPILPLQEASPTAFDATRPLPASSRQRPGRDGVH